MKKVFLFVLVFTSIFQVNAQVNMNQGLQLYLPFSGNAQDASGNGNNGIISGATLTSDENNIPNSAYYFNGNSDHISIPNSNSLNPTGAMSICVKVKMQGFYDGFCYNNVIIAKGADISTSNVSHYSIRTSQTLTNDCNFEDTTNHNFRFDYNGNGNATGPAINAVANNTPHVALNNWDCIVGIYDGDDSTRIYVNGVLRYTLEVTNKQINSDELTIGYSSTSTLYPFWFKGVIDEVRIYDRAINQDEINYYCSKSFPESVSQLTLSDHFQVFPNPTHNVLNVVSNQSNKKIQAYQLSNMQGQVISKKRNLTTSRLKISTGKLTAGIYILELQSNDNLKLTQRVIID